MGMWPKHAWYTLHNTSKLQIWICKRCWIYRRANKHYKGEYPGFVYYMHGQKMGHSPACEPHNRMPHTANLRR